MTNLQDYMQDGAHYNARAVLMLIQGLFYIEESWNDEYKEYDAKPKVARWENCREQGYVISLDVRPFKQGVQRLNIAFFEHRNSDSICAVAWEQDGINSINIDTMNHEKYMNDKYAVDHSVSYNQAYDMAEWICEQFKEYWLKNSK